MATASLLRTHSALPSVDRPRPTFRIPPYGDIGALLARSKAGESKEYPLQIDSDIECSDSSVPEDEAAIIPPTSGPTPTEQGGPYSQETVEAAALQQGSDISSGDAAARKPIRERPLQAPIEPFAYPIIQSPVNKQAVPETTGALAFPRSSLARQATSAGNARPGTDGGSKSMSEALPRIPPSLPAPTLASQRMVATPRRRVRISFLEMPGSDDDHDHRPQSSLPLPVATNTAPVLDHATGPHRHNTTARAPTAPSSPPSQPDQSASGHENRPLENDRRRVYARTTGELASSTNSRHVCDDSFGCRDQATCESDGRYTHGSGPLPKRRRVARRLPAVQERQTGKSRRSSPTRIATGGRTCSPPYKDAEPRSILDIFNMPDGRPVQNDIDTQHNRRPVDGSMPLAPTGTPPDPAPLRRYELERIVEQQGDMHYIKWKNYPASENTWEPLAHLDGCEDALAEFRREQHQGLRRIDS